MSNTSPLGALNSQLQNRRAILLVEDNADVQEFNQFLLEKQGFTVDTADTLAAARVIVARRMPDAIVLDIGLPDGSGLDFLREIRSGNLKMENGEWNEHKKNRQTSQLSTLISQLKNVPVLVLTGYGKDGDVVRGFKSGCDDYLSKPYTFEVLLARLMHMLQSAQQVPKQMTYGSLKLDVLGGKAFLNGVDLTLAQKEFALLLTLAQNAGQALDAGYLYEKIWGQAMNDNTSALKNMVYRLRKKIKGSGYDIMAQRGQGYVFETE